MAYALKGGGVGGGDACFFNDAMFSNSKTEVGETDFFILKARTLGIFTCLH